jgi:hypothetical protein
MTEAPIARQKTRSETIDEKLAGLTIIIACSFSDADRNPYQSSWRIAVNELQKPVFCKAGTLSRQFELGLSAVAERGQWLTAFAKPL